MASSASAAKDSNRPKVFLEFATDSKFLGRVVIELFHKEVPYCVKNFIGLCVGSRKTAGTVSAKPLHYKNTEVFRIEKFAAIYAGDIVGDGIGESIYGGYVHDEGYPATFDQAGVVGMAEVHEHGIGSAFFITVGPAPQFDGKRVAVGRLVSGLDTAFRIERLCSDSSDRPSVRIEIRDCGLLPDENEPATPPAAAAPGATAPTAAPTAAAAAAATRVSELAKRERERVHRAVTETLLSAPKRHHGGGTHAAAALAMPFADLDGSNSDDSSDSGSGDDSAASRA